MSRGTLVFSHANSYPAPTYRRLFQAWEAAGWRVLAKEKFGHDPAWPVVSGWRPSRDELLAFVDQHAPGERIHWVGHSLGGYLSIMAAMKRPAQSAAVVLIDSPLVAGWRAHSWAVLKMMHLEERVSPAKLSRTRRWQWPSREAAHAHFSAKRLYARWDPAVLHDYLDGGLAPDPAHGPEAVQLAFRREVETRFYKTLPHDLGAMLRKHPPRCPVSFIGGRQSAEIRQAGLETTLKLVRHRVQWLDGTHLFPMEQPNETVQAVLQALDGTAPGA
jgi:pimeloyl-ACP methyl ester carboxylesterase